MSPEQEVEMKSGVVIKEGKLTSEYATAKSTGWIMYLVMAIGAILAYTPQITGAVGDSGASTWVGGILAAIAVGGKVLISLGYMNSRTVVKASADKLAANSEK